MRNNITGLKKNLKSKLAGAFSKKPPAGPPALLKKTGPVSEAKVSDLGLKKGHTLRDIIEEDVKSAGDSDIASGNIGSSASMGTSMPFDFSKLRKKPAAGGANQRRGTFVFSEEDEVSSRSSQTRIKEDPDYFPRSPE